MTPEPVAKAYAIASRDLVASFTPAEVLSLRYWADMWLRPEQTIPRGKWRYYGFISGRGWGKTMGIASDCNRAIEAGEVRHLGCMAPTEDRVSQVQFQNLIDTAKPWLRPERYRGGLRWPNGATAIAFTPERPGHSRSENLDRSWLTEIVDWQATTRREAFDNITTATRTGPAQVVWDTTSKGKNDVILHLEDLHAEDPAAYPIVRGTMFDNPMLSRRYLRSEVRKYSGRRYEEEVLGRVFREAAGALVQQEWLDRARVAEAPPLDLVLVSIDPALSAHPDADECGIVIGGRGEGGCYVLDDLSRRCGPEEWGDIAITQAIERRATGIAIERNRLGDHATSTLRARAEAYRKRHGVDVSIRVLDKNKPFPRSRVPGTIFVKELVSYSDKASRANAPAAATEDGRVHVVGDLAALEFELTTFVPGAGQKSPNRLDAWAQLVNEALELGEDVPEQARQATAAVQIAREQLHARTLRNPTAPLGRGRGKLGI